MICLHTKSHTAHLFGNKICKYKNKRKLIIKLCSLAIKYNLKKKVIFYDINILKSVIL
jgi:hypothetical protein